jgi:hypothetical protein
MSTDLIALLPASKHDTEKAQALIELGHPAIEPILPTLLEWMQDPNWPVSLVLQPYLASIGRALAPHVVPILEGNDEIWKHCVISTVVRRSSELAHALLPQLQRIANKPSANEIREEVDCVAQDVLQAIETAGHRC